MGGNYDSQYARQKKPSVKIVPNLSKDLASARSFAPRLSCLRVSVSSTRNMPPTLRRCEFFGSCAHSHALMNASVPLVNQSSAVHARHAEKHLRLMVDENDSAVAGLCAASRKAWNTRQFVCVKIARK